VREAGGSGWLVRWALRPEFEAHGATGKWEFMMTRLAMIEAMAT
jgi:hypothetical protein